MGATVASAFAYVVPSALAIGGLAGWFAAAGGRQCEPCVEGAACPPCPPSALQLFCGAIALCGTGWLLLLAGRAVWDRAHRGLPSAVEGAYREPGEASHLRIEHPAEVGRRAALLTGLIGMVLLVFGIWPLVRMPKGAFEILAPIGVAGGLCVAFYLFLLARRWWRDRPAGELVCGADGMEWDGRARRVTVRFDEVVRVSPSPKVSKLYELWLVDGQSLPLPGWLGPAGHARVVSHLREHGPSHLSLPPAPVLRTRRRDGRLDRVLDLMVVSAITLPLLCWVGFCIGYVTAMGEEGLLMLGVALYRRNLRDPAATIIVFIIFTVALLVAGVLAFRIFVGLCQRILLRMGRSLEEHGAFEYAACQALLIAVLWITWLVLCFLFQASDVIPVASLGLLLPGLAFVNAYVAYRWRFEDA